MKFTHPFSIYGLALVLFRENLENVQEVQTTMFEKYLEEGLNHFRLKATNTLDDEVINFEFSPTKNGDTSKGVYLAPNTLTSDYDASETWDAIETIRNNLKLNSDISRIHKEKFIVGDDKYKDCNLTMSIVPISGKINNGNASQGYTKTSFLEFLSCAVTTSTPFKPCFGYKEKRDSAPIPTAIIPDLTLDQMKVFIEFYNIMLDRNINKKKLLQKKVFRKEGQKPTFTRPPIYDGNFPYAPKNSAFGVVGLLGAMGRWAKEAGYSKKGEEVLESLKEKPLYLIQYGKAQSVTINHYIIDLAKDNKLSDIVFAIQKSKLIHPFDETKQKDKKGIESRNEVFNLFSSRFLQLFNKSTFKDFLSIRAEYEPELIELFNTFFMNEMNQIKIKKEVVQSALVLGKWLNQVAYFVGLKEANNQKKPHLKYELKAKCLVELESSIFGSRRPAEMLNVITRAGRLSGDSAPSESTIFQEAFLTGEISMEDAKNMLMAFARIRNPSQPKDASNASPAVENEDEENSDASH